MSAATALQPLMRSPSPERLSVFGALHLAAATAAAAAQDRDMTTELLATARGIADRTGNANHMGPDSATSTSRHTPSPHRGGLVPRTVTLTAQSQVRAVGGGRVGL
jgi:hypothetical protein